MKGHLKQAIQLVQKKGILSSFTLILGETQLQAKNQDDFKLKVEKEYIL